MEENSEECEDNSSNISPISRFGPGSISSFRAGNQKYIINANSPNQEVIESNTPIDSLTPRLGKIIMKKSGVAKDNWGGKTPVPMTGMIGRHDFGNVVPNLKKRMNQDV